MGAVSPRIHEYFGGTTDPHNPLTSQLTKVTFRQNLSHMLLVIRAIPSSVSKLMFAFFETQRNASRNVLGYRCMRLTIVLNFPTISFELSAFQMNVQQQVTAVGPAVKKLNAD